MASVVLRTPADIGAMMRARRRALGINQSELAGLVGVGKLWVNQVERGKPGANLGLVLRALAALDIELTGVTGDSSSAKSAGEPVVSPDINAIIANARHKE
jgi:HTH-type transcriptional regulator / antitoxin HipB